MARAYVPDYGQVRALIESAYSGDVGALSELQSLSSSMAKRANVRLKALETSDLTASPAYRRAEYYLNEERNRTRFSESKKMTAGELEDQLGQLYGFFGDPSASVEYEKNREAGLESSFPDMNVNEKRQMRNFLSSDAFADMKKIIGSSIIREAAQAIEEGARVKDLEKAYAAYLEKTEGPADPDTPDIFDVWDNWVQGEYEDY